MTESNDAIITKFCNAWGAGDLETVLGSFADDAVYHNIPMDPLVGKETIDAVISGFFTSGRIVFETLHQIVDGDMVMNERIDIIAMGDTNVSLPVMGVFELVDGKIAAWRDYFDLATFNGG